LIGKWHLGSKPAWGPNKFWIDHSYGSLAGGVDPFDHRYKTGPYTHTWHRDPSILPVPGDTQLRELEIAVPTRDCRSSDDCHDLPPRQRLIAIPRTPALSRTERGLASGFWDGPSDHVGDSIVFAAGRAKVPVGLVAINGLFGELQAKHGRVQRGKVPRRCR